MNTCTSVDRGTHVNVYITNHMAELEQSVISDVCDQSPFCGLWCDCEWHWGC